jgi:hypothetical protein
MKPIRTTALNLPSLRLEGSLFLPDILEKAALGQGRLQAEGDYGLPKGLKLRDEASRAFQIASAQWRTFASLVERTDVKPQRASTQFISDLLRDAFAYPALAAVSAVPVGDRLYPITHLAHAAPAAQAAGAKPIAIVIAPYNQGLDDPDPRFAVQGSGAKRKSPFQLAQEFLNASAEHQWALVTNGRTLRLLRDAATLTRPSYLEMDLQDLLAGQRFVEFGSAWRLLHASRAGLLDVATEDPAKTAPPVAWASWQQAGQEEGTRVREGLRRGVTDALITLGQGFVQHPANEALRQKLQAGDLKREDYFAQLLRLVYRFIFLFTVEERGLVPTAAQPADGDTTAQARRTAAQLYADGYAMTRLRDLALRRRAHTRFDDLWQAVRIVFRGLGQGQPRLGLPALGGLFASSQCEDLDSASLTNAALLSTMKSLRWASAAGGALAPIDYRNMGTEELGSVYESLLELVPEVDVHARSFGFVGLTSEGSTAGNERKTSGSYYTPDSLVQELIRSALDPVIEDRLAKNPAQPVEALLALRVVDPACGSGHFLLAAARRLAERVAALRSADGAVTPHAYRHALREVVARCIFGVDRNPMAIELARTALWIEGFEEGRPLSFMDHHLQCGDALLGLTDLKALEYGIAKDAFKPLSGDDKAVCKELTKANSAALKDLEKKRVAKAFGQLDVVHQADSGLAALQAIEAMPEGDTAQIDAKAQAYDSYLTEVRTGRLAQAAQLLLGSYLLAKTEVTAHAIPTTSTLYLTLEGVPLPSNQRTALKSADDACKYARVLHWPLAFPQVFAAGGFDCVLGNPPWERIKLQEEEFFATRHKAIVEAKNKAERSQRIQWLSEGMLAQHLYPGTGLGQDTAVGEKERELYAEFITARRTAEAASLFAHVNGEDGGRYPLTGVGDVNTYALFAETISQVVRADGRAGFIVPTGIATDDSTKAYFGHITQKGRLISLFDIENREAVFPSVHRSFKFCLLTLGAASQAEFVCFVTQVNQLNDPRRRFKLTPEEFRLINPNTLTCPVFRSERDAELTKKIYRTAPVLIDEGEPSGNPMGISFHTRLFHMAEDSHLFFDTPSDDRLPLYEAKMAHQFDHRWATYQNSTENSRDLTEAEKGDFNFAVSPRYWVSAVAVKNRLNKMGWERNWLLGWRDICRSTDVRTLIATVIPRSAVGDKFLLMFPSLAPDKTAALLANLNSLVCDFVARQKVGGTSLKTFTMRQIPVFDANQYSQTDLQFIVPRVLKLTYTSYDMKPWALDLGYSSEPFLFDPPRRAQLRAELDAYYAQRYGLTREELRYVLDPEDVMGQGYPSETFRVLRDKEKREFGEYRTSKLVLDAWDRLQAGTLT